jgi:hypothetical protein
LDPLWSLEMDKLFEQLKIEIEEEKRKHYLARFGRLPESVEQQHRPLKDFN